MSPLAILGLDRLSFIRLGLGKLGLLLSDSCLTKELVLSEGRTAVRHESKDRIRLISLLLGHIPRLDWWGFLWYDLSELQYKLQIVPIYKFTNQLAATA